MTEPADSTTVTVIFQLDDQWYVNLQGNVWVDHPATVSCQSREAGRRIVTAHLRRLAAPAESGGEVSSA